MKAYATQALPRVQMISFRLERISAQTAGGGAIGTLVDDYRALVALYKTASAGSPAGGAALIRRVQRRTAAAARALHLAGCAPV